MHTYGMSHVLSLWRGWISVRARATPPTAADIALGVAEAHGLTLAQLRSATRRAAISRPRQAAMAALRAQRRSDGRPRFSYPWIARFFGLKHHATVIHGVRAHAARRAAEEASR
jgi:chromosomal replication initiation ATPase DnaA